MGLLIRQDRNTKEWIIGIREQWRIKDFKLPENNDAKETVDFLVSNKIKFTIDYIGDDLLIVFNNVERRFEDYALMKEVFYVLLGYKYKYVK